MPHCEFCGAILTGRAKKACLTCPSPEYIRQETRRIQETWGESRLDPYSEPVTTRLVKIHSNIPAEPLNEY